MTKQVTINGTSRTPVERAVLATAAKKRQIEAVARKRQDAWAAGRTNDAARLTTDLNRLREQLHRERVELFGRFPQLADGTDCRRRAHHLEQNRGPVA